MKDKIDRLLDILDNPDRYSDENINQLLEDPEIRDYYETISKTSDIFSETAEIDIDWEWQKFVNKNFRPQPKNIFGRVLYFVTRNAAVIILCAVASFAVVAATIGVHYALSHQNDIQLKNTDTLSVIETAPVTLDDSVREGAPVANDIETTVFKNKSLGEILSSIADYYGADLQFESNTAKELRLFFQWDKTLPIEETVEQLNNFEQFDIEFTDNTIIIK